MLLLIFVLLKLLQFQIPENSNSTFISIIRGISSGKIAVPTLTFNESLELLIEHGLEKLKNDYLCVINHFCSVPSEALMSDWQYVFFTIATTIL